MGLLLLFLPFPFENKTGTSAKSRPYDIENLSLNYAYTEINHHDINIEYDNQKMHKGGIDLNKVLIKLSFFCDRFCIIVSKRQCKLSEQFCRQGITG